MESNVNFGPEMLLDFNFYALQFVASLTQDRNFYCYKQLELFVYAVSTIHELYTKKNISLTHNGVCVFNLVLEFLKFM